MCPMSIILWKYAEASRSSGWRTMTNDRNELNSSMADNVILGEEGEGKRRRS